MLDSNAQGPAASLPLTPIAPTQAQSSYQRDIKTRTANLRQALHKSDEESALIFRSLPTITDPSANSSKANKVIATEADDLVHGLTNTLSRWRRTSAIAAETFAELLAETSTDREVLLSLEREISQADKDIQSLWLTTTRIQAEIDYVETLLQREEQAVLVVSNQDKTSASGVSMK